MYLKLFLLSCGFEWKETSNYLSLCPQVGRHCRERSFRSASTEPQRDRERSKNSLAKWYSAWKPQNKEPQTTIFVYLKAVFSTVNIYSFFFFNNNKTADKDCLKNYFSVSRNVSHTHTLLMSHKNTLVAPEQFKRKCLFKMRCTKADAPSCIFILSPWFEPCAWMANRRKDFQQTWEVESGPPRHYSKIRFAFSHVVVMWRIWCRQAHWDPCLKGSLYRCQPSRGGGGGSDTHAHVI